MIAFVIKRIYQNDYYTLIYNKYTKFIDEALIFKTEKQAQDFLKYYSKLPDDSKIIKIKISEVEDEV